MVVDIALLLGAIAVFDLVRTRFKWRRDLRMTKEEVKRERKEAEGDPLVKSRMRMLAISRVRARMMASVPKASVVIVNPTHLSIALRFVREKDDAPVVVAKGKDLVALRIREIAALHDIPVIENRPLVRAMFDQVEVDARIPVQFYKAVAVIINQISRRGALARSPQF